MVLLWFLLWLTGTSNLSVGMVGAMFGMSESFDMLKPCSLAVADRLVSRSRLALRLCSVYLCIQNGRKAVSKSGRASPSAT
jgi:hypothetical protein